MVLGEVRRYLRDNSSIRVSRSIKDVAYKVLKLKDELTVKNGVEPTNKELAQILEIEEKDINQAMEALRPPVSLFKPIYRTMVETPIYLFESNKWWQNKRRPRHKTSSKQSNIKTNRKRKIHPRPKIHNRKNPNGNSKRNRYKPSPNIKTWKNSTPKS